MSLVVDYGGALLLIVTFLSCLAAPVPSSLLMLTGGGFVASGDLTLINAASAAYFGAILGDQTGFQIGRRAGPLIESKLAKAPKRAALQHKATGFIEHYGGAGVFLSRWLFSPLGPYVNFAAGAAGLNWIRFTVWASIGESVWVTIYIGLGFVFADRITGLADILSNASGFLAAGIVTVGLGFWLHMAAKQAKSRKPH